MQRSFDLIYHLPPKAKVSETHSCILSAFIMDDHKKHIPVTKPVESECSAMLQSLFIFLFI